MLSFAADFWPLFWTIIGSGALVTGALTLLVATFPPAWFRRHQPALTPEDRHDYLARPEAPEAKAA